MNLLHSVRNSNHISLFVILFYGTFLSHQHYSNAWAPLSTKSGVKTVNVLTWSPSFCKNKKIRNARKFYAKSDASMEADTDNDTRMENMTVDVDESKAAADDVEWGVSYIGGDPCGSKYNDDPFDAKPSKPGFPDDMKARIDALMEQKKRESEQKKNYN